MTVGDAILSLVDKLLEEKERVIRLEMQQQLNENMQLNKDQQ